MNPTSTALAPVTLTAPEPNAIRAGYADYLEAASGMTVSNQSEHGQALSLIKDLASAERKVVDAFKDAKSAAHKAHKAISSLEAQLLDPIIEAKKALTARCFTYEQEEWKRAQAKAKEDAEKARLAEEERLLQDAVAAEKAGDKAGAEAILAEPVQAVVVAANPELGQAKGVGLATLHDAEVTDLKELVLYVAARCEVDPGVLSYLEPAMPALRAVARAQKEKMSIPGVRSFAKPSARVSR